MPTLRPRYAVRRVLLTATALVYTAGLAAQQAPLQPPQAFIRDMVYNELQDRERDSFWQYHILRRTGGDSFSEWQVETKFGPIHRVLAKNGQPLTGKALEEENARLKLLFGSQSELQHNLEQHQADERRLQRLMKLMPQAFLFDYEGQPAGNMATVRFRPDPAFNPPTYESRLYHSMAGTLVVNTRLKRLVDLHGVLIERVEFGYGLLGHIEKGGAFEIRREQVSPTHWKTDLVDVRVQGRVILFKTVSKDEHEERSGFQPVSRELTMNQVRALLDARITEPDAQSVPRVTVQEPD